MEGADQQLKELISSWMEWDKNESTRAEIETMVKNSEWSKLEKLMKKRLEFGTAGLRGRMGPGFAQMNDLVIIQTTQGLRSYLEECFQNIKKAGVVFGFDGRYNSKRWARLAANVFLRAGIRVYLFNTTTPTPFVPFAINQLGAVAGVMVTASHNPKWDNGYKVYWDNGSQILSPHDKNIQEAIMKNLVPEDGAYEEESPFDNLLDNPLETIWKGYSSMIKDNAYDIKINNGFNEKVVYTAMHGVGYPYVLESWKAAGFKEELLIAVDEQRDPDPEFSTVDFPNPEEGPTSLLLSFKKADQVGARYILANDPDADRLCVAQKLSTGWKIFSGNETGALLGWWILKVYKEKNPDADLSKAHFISSTVSSKVLETISKKEGTKFTDTLTGFKHMGNVGHGYLLKGDTVLFAFEEAIGFMCSSKILDKDGVSAATKLTEMMAYLAQQGSTLSDQLEKIYFEYGYHCSSNDYYICHDPVLTQTIFDKIRTGSNGSYPETLTGVKVTAVRDLTTNYDSRTEDKKATLPSSKSSNMITFWMDNGMVLTLRTSGTEPKIKFYSELCGKSGVNPSEWPGLKTNLEATIRGCVEELLEPAKNGILSSSEAKK